MPSPASWLSSIMLCYPTCRGIGRSMSLRASVVSYPSRRQQRLRRLWELPPQTPTEGRTGGNTPTPRCRILCLPATKNENTVLPVLNSMNCWYCGCLLETPATHRLLQKRNRASVDHQTPRSRGGGEVNNLVPACLRCNGQKRDMTVDEYRVWLMPRRGTHVVFFGETHSISNFISP